MKKGRAPFEPAGALLFYLIANCEEMTQRRSAHHLDFDVGRF
jgi:hypothetical protein